MPLKSTERQLHIAAKGAWEYVYEQFLEHYADEWFRFSMKARLPHEDWENVTDAEWDRLNEMITEELNEEEFADVRDNNERE